MAGQRWALRVSILGIAVMWVLSLLSHTRSGADKMPESVAQIALFVVINGAIQCSVMAALLAWGGEGPAAIGLRRAGLLGQVARGAGFGALIFVVVNVGLTAVLTALMPGSDDASAPIASLFKDRADLPLWIFCGVVGGGFVEELSRAFVLTRWRRFGGRAGLIAALVIDTTVFGMGHLYQGAPGALSAGVAGLCNALVFLRKDSAVEAITAHAIFDVMGILGGYLVYAQPA